MYFSIGINIVNIVLQLQSAIVALCGFMKIKHVTAKGYTLKYSISVAVFSRGFI